MHPLIRIPYLAAGSITRAAVAISPRRSSKILRALSARRGVLERYEAWAAAHRDPDRPLFWFHAPSVGEGLQALPVIDRIRGRIGGAQIAYTFFSPSAERFASRLGADFTDFLPFDTKGNAARCLDALRPAVLVFSKLDVWPMLTEAASERGTKVALMSGTVPEGSGRRSGIAGLALRDAYRSLDAVGAVSKEDAARLIEMGVAPERIEVSGDTRYDQVWSRATNPTAEGIAVADRFRDSRPTLVAGSTWPSDEQHLLPAWIQLKRTIPAARLIIAPHELSDTHLDSIVDWAARSSLTLSRTSEPTPRATEVVLVDQYGILGDLYAVADAAFVGGGFQDAGLHSLLEPAAYGAPVLIGPRHTDNRDAGLLVASGAAARCSGAGDITARLSAWFATPHMRERASVAAKTVVQSELGASDRSSEMIESLLR
ncbi:MAG TPA: glycosyltransferase N-terminal domain-containing protein [Gemmatimonadaceae bacterium]|nr:glycosyltransferase N-terminal domain-containing protein [Gemmatimonadaceae bacterium]